MIRLLNAQPGLDSLDRESLQQLVSFPPPLATLSKDGRIFPSNPWGRSNEIYGKGTNSSSARPQMVRPLDSCTCHRMSDL